MTRIEAWALDGLPEVAESDDLAELIASTVRLSDGDIVVVTSKVVSKAEGRVREGDRDVALEEETDRVVATRGHTTIVRNRLGLTMAAAGIDASNVRAGHIVLLPLDPDRSAREIRARLQQLTGACVGVVITDTAGRAWREGQTDIAIGAAGLLVAEDFSGRVDGYGNRLVVTMPAVADEIAATAELAQGKLGGRPVAVLRGRADLVLAPDDDGPGAGSLIRDESADLFGYGAREAVVRALLADPEDQAPFGAPAPWTELESALSRLVRAGDAGSMLDPTSGSESDARVRFPVGVDQTAVNAVVYAHGWRVLEWQPTESEVWAVLSPSTP